MEPSGDPEARIRDLERPLADQAGASEVSTRAFEAPASPGASVNVPVPPPYPYGAPPADPYQAQYGSPYYAPPQQVVRKRSQPALWLIPLIVGVVIAAGVVGAVAYFFVGNSSTPGTPGVSGGGGSVDVPSIPSLPQIPGVDPGAGGSDEPTTVEAGGSLSIGGIDKKQTVICNQGVVNISGMNNTIDVQGSCASVSVSGMDNVITVESAGTISTSGFDNKVIYRNGDPQTSESGTGNVIEKG